MVWQSGGQDGSDLGVFGQRFDGSGAKLGGEFQVNTSTSLNQADPSIAMDKAGNFVVVWSSNRNDFAHDDIFGQRFDSSGAKLGSEFPVNISTALPSLEPSIAMDGAGNFVVIWSLGLFSSDVFGQRFDVSGAKIGAEFEVNTFTTDIQFRPSVAMAKNGKFVVVWAGSDGSHEQIFGQRFGPSGAKVGAEFRVNTFTAASHLSRPSRWTPPATSSWPGLATIKTDPNPGFSVSDSKAPGPGSAASSRSTPLRQAFKRTQG